MTFVKGALDQFDINNVTKCNHIKHIPLVKEIQSQIHSLIWYTVPLDSHNKHHLRLPKERDVTLGGRGSQ